MNDYSDYISSPEESMEGLAQLSGLADHQAEAALAVELAEEQLSRAKELLKVISERQVPELMDSLGLEEFKTNTGLCIGIKETVQASIPKVREDEAFKWLRDKGFGRLIKRAMSVQFAKGEDKKADKMAELLGDEFDLQEKVSVHHSTLRAFIAERLKEGDEIPLDLFGVHRRRVSVIK